tara:strand:- start:3773 stop:3898 length:126 start_codon:yes stop_codon:yes gene_type:complete
MHEKFMSFKPLENILLSDVVTGMKKCLKSIWLQLKGLKPNL